MSGPLRGNSRWIASARHLSRRATRLGVRAAPTVSAFRDGKEIGRRVGLTTADKLLALLETA